MKLHVLFYLGILLIIAASLAKGETEIVKNLTISKKSVLILPVFISNDLSSELKSLAEEEKNVYILLNVPLGGKVIESNQLIKTIQILKEKGIKVHCINSNTVFSAGLDIYLSCSELYFLENSRVHFHQVVWYTGSGKDWTIRDLTAILEAMNQTMKDRIDNYTYVLKDRDKVIQKFMQESNLSSEEFSLDFPNLKLTKITDLIITD